MAQDAVTGPKNEPRFSDTGAPDIGVDPTLVAAYAALVGNRKVNTAAARAAATGKEVWEGLQWFETDTGSQYAYRSGSWVLESSLSTAFTPSITGLTLGTGGSVLYARRSISSGREFIKVGWKLGTAGFVVSDPQLQAPSGFASWFSSSVTPLGIATYIDASAGGSGRFGGPVYSTSSAIRFQYGFGPMTNLGAAIPFTWGANDEIHLDVSYPIA